MRPEALAVGGYFPTPTHLLPRLSGLISPVVFPPLKTKWETRNHCVAFVDPCAGTGGAIITIRNTLLDTTSEDSRSEEIAIFACELEKTRHNTLSTVVNWKRAVHSDAFRLSFAVKENCGASLLFLNPPYDTDRQHGRLEEKFLARFTDVLMVGGLLVYIVPFYALAASARTLATHYESIQCFRFPETDFGFKQVAFYAKKRQERLTPDALIFQQSLDWSADPSKIPVLPEAPTPLYSLPLSECYSDPISEWKERIVDTQALCRKFKLWHMTPKRNAPDVQVENCLPASSVADLLLRTYPVATPPRPAHIAAGIASGLFNGARITSPDPNLPPLLVKGVFDREYKTIEEKLNKDGKVKSVVQVQQPKLVITALNLETFRYSTLQSGVEATDATEIEKFSAADLLKHYGDSLMSVMQKQCPVLYDPRRDAASIPLTEAKRPLYSAQAHATKALVKLFGGPGLRVKERRGKTAILLGEIGVGKSGVSLVTARTCGARRVLVMCPPHLLDGWKEQVEAIAPGAEVRVLGDVADLESAAASKAEFQVAILSREAAKLGHSLASAGATCPKCGSLTPPDVDFVKKRARCEHRPPVPMDAIARATRDLAIRMLPYTRHSGIPTMLDGRFVRRMLAQPATPDFKPTVGEMDGVIELLLKRGGADKAIVMALLAAGDAARIAWVARSLLEAQRSHHYSSSYLVHQLLLMLPPDSADQHSIPVEFKPKREYGSEIDLDVEIAKLRGGDNVLYPTWGETKLSFAWRDGVLTVDRKEASSLEAMNAAFDAIARLGAWEFGDECDEFLYQSVPEPRRIALAKHIARYYPNTFDFIILDEGHEFSSDSSAQSFAAHRLSGLKAPTLLMTGSLMNGYAESMFVNMWGLSPAFRSEFDRGDKQRYIDRYGYRKRILEDRDEDGEVVEFGSMSDRVTRSERIVGSAPGVLPLFLLQHLLPLAVTLHKSDLALDLPACKLSMHEVACSPEQFKRYTDLKEDLIAAIKRDRFDEEKSGKLFGQLAELPSYLDRATEDVGNVEGGAFEIRYPESLDSELVSSQPGFSRDTVLPKERWMLDQLERELAEGRNAMVFTWHVGLLPRISRLISDTLGVEAPILYADKVGTSKRQAWITKEIVRRGRRVLVTNPVAIQTGLNNLVHFSTELWLESPACNPITYRQAVGRVDRIGQTKETRILYPVYADTLQEAMYDLLMKKVAVSVSTDGLDSESALVAAGLGDDAALTGLSIGKQLWALIGGLDDEAPLRAHTKGRRA